MQAGGELIGGRYALGELLGVGGTGSVFAAIDVGEEEPGLQVAVKLLHPHLCADAASREAFLREAAHAIQVQHPNVVRVHAAGLHDAGGVTMPWIALDLLRGSTLRERVDRDGPLRADEAAELAQGMLAALSAAHAEGLVHRDISPQNILVVDDGPLRAEAVRIVDFGLADVSGRSTLGGDILLAGSAEAVGVVGNAAFMSPEQAQGRPVRAVSDLYQAGAVLYFALTGRVPFPRDDTAQAMRAHISAPPPVPSALVPAARGFDRVVTRALAKTPAHRFRSADEFAEAVRAIAPPIIEHPADPPPAHTARTRILTADTDGDPLGYLSPTPSTDPAPAARGSSGIAAGIVGVVILALGVWAVAAVALPASPAAEPSPSASAEVSAAPAPTASETAAIDAPPAAVPAASEVMVPVLLGSVADADAALRAAGLVLGSVTRVESAEEADRVLAQNPPAGQPSVPGAAVNITAASGNNVVPQVTGMTAATAAAVLGTAGFTVDASRTPDAAVVGTQPAAGAVLRRGVVIALVLAPLPSSPLPTPHATDPTPRPTEDTP